MTAGLGSRANGRPRVVLFDLDGTLADSAAGIIAALRHAFAVNDIPLPDEVRLRGLLGPPFRDTLPPIVGADRFPAVFAAYRERYATTMLDVAPFPGVGAVIDRVRASGARVGVATSKAERFAVPIVAHLGLPAIDTVCGDTLDGARPDKAAVIAEALIRLGSPDPSAVLMVGDRSADVVGARAVGVDTVAVRWGYAKPGELEAARPAHLVDDADELAGVLGV